MEATRVVEKLLTQPAFGNLVARIEAHFAKPVSDYLKDRESSGEKLTGKAVKDAVWGMIDLAPREILVLDSPILQRLQHIRQLGVTYFTYPTAGYSRYEHTLGAMHQAERMLRAISKSSGEQQLLEDTDTVRLAALLHDIGHLPFSHVSERYYDERECVDKKLVEEIEQIKSEIALNLPARIHRFSECLSIASALTPSAQKVLKAEGAGYTDEQVAEAILCIVGRPPSLKRAYLAQIITNVIDADKLDYMFRDALYTRVPLGVDLERLLYKLRCISVSSDQCPKDMAEMFEQSGDARVLGTDLAGQWHAYDLAASRTMLFERVYLHHKTLAAERVVLRVLANLNKHPADLLCEDDRFFSHYAASKHPSENLKHLQCLDWRRLPRRVYAVSYGFLTPIVGENGEFPDVSEPLKEAWDSLERSLQRADKRRALELEIGALARRIASDLKVGLSSFEIWIDTPPQTFKFPEVDLLIERPDKTIIRQSAFAPEAAAFAKSPFALSHVYVTGTGRAARQIVFLATEILFARKFKLALGRAAADHAKIDWKAVEDWKRDLEQRQLDFFNDVRQIRPKSLVARTPATRKRILALAQKFAHYQVDSEIVIDVERIQTFLDQFPEKLVELMLLALEAITFLGRSELGKKFSATIKASQPENDVCVPLSHGSQKSSAVVGYYLGDDPDGPKLASFDEALENESSITFVDDCLLSGTQACDIVRKWFGLANALDPGIANELSLDQQKSLRSKCVRFRFMYATHGGIEQLKKLVAEVGISVDVAASDVVSLNPKQLDTISVKDTADELRNFLQGVGYELLASTKGIDNPTKWNEQRCRDYSLGYGGLELLLIMTYNTPTATITPLWKGGTYCGVPWLPLFPRRGESSPRLLPNN